MCVCAQVQSAPACCCMTSAGTCTGAGTDAGKSCKCQIMLMLRCHDLSHVHLKARCDIVSCPNFAEQDKSMSRLYGQSSVSRTVILCGTMQPSTTSEQRSGSDPERSRQAVALMTAAVLLIASVSERWFYRLHWITIKQTVRQCQQHDTITHLCLTMVI